MGISLIIPIIIPIIGLFLDNRPTHKSKNSNHDSNRNPEPLPMYEEEVILVNNPEDPNNPIKKRILKRVKTEYDAEEDDYQDLYILDESE